MTTPVPVGDPLTGLRSAPGPEGRPPWPVVVDIGRRLADLLEQILRAGVVQVGLEPETVVRDPVTGDLTLLDFGRARFLADRTASDGAATTPAGATHDLIALGRLLIWLLSGHRTTGTVVDNSRWTSTLRDAPALVPQVVARLLAAGGPGGYRSFAAVRDDLTLLAENPDATDLGPLGRPTRFTIPSLRIGREPEAAALVQAYSDVAEEPLGGVTDQPGGRRGVSTLVLVDGRSGVGKTALITAACRSMERHGARIAKGKFNQFGDGRPLSALADALDVLLLRLRSEDVRPRQVLVDRVLAALADQGGALVEFVPRLTELIGQQPTPPELSGDASRIRFEFLLRRLLGALASREHPLVLVLDDLHWADAASFDLLRSLLRDGALRHLLVIGAFRSEAVDDEHPLMRTVDRIQQDGSDLRTVTVAPWTAADVTRLATLSGLGGDPGVHALASLLAATANGNPLGVLQAFWAVHGSGALRFDEDTDRWHVDLAVAEDTVRGADTVDLVRRRLDLLPQPTRATLSTSAFLGPETDLQTLAAATRSDPLTTLRTVWPALVEGLLQSEVGHSSIRLRAAHDVVQQAAHEDVGEQHGPDLHVRIGQALLQAYRTEDTLTEHLFEVVDHLNSAGPHAIRTEQDRMMTLLLNASAGRRARAGGAARAALRHFTRALELVPEQAWAHEPEQTYALHWDAAEAAYLTAEFAVLDELVDTLLAHTDDPVAVARALELRIQGLVARNRLADALQCGAQALELLDHPLVEGLDPSGWPPVPGLADFPPDVRSTPQADTALRVLVWLTPCAYITSFEMYARVILSMIALSALHPGSPLTPLSYTNYGLVLCGVGRNDEGFQSGELARALSDRVGDEPLRCKVRALTYGFLQHWQRPAEESLPHLLDTVKAAMLCGDQEYVGYASFLYCDKAWGIQHLDDLDRMHAEHTSAVELFGHDFSWRHCLVWLQFVRSMRGRNPEGLWLCGESFDDRTDLDRLAAAENRFSLFTAHVTRGWLAWHRGDPQDALQACRTAGEYATTAVATLLSVDHLVLSCLVELHLAREQDPGGATVPPAVDPMLTQLRRWADFAPENLAHKVALVEAERAWTLGDLSAAMAGFDRAAELVHRTAFRHDEALVAERRATLSRSTGDLRAATDHLLRAYRLHLDRGATAVAEALLDRHPWLDPTLGTDGGAPLTAEIGLGLLERFSRLLTELHSHRVTVVLDEDDTVVSAHVAGDGSVVLSTLHDPGPDDLPHAWLHQVRSTGRFRELQDPARNGHPDDRAYFARRATRSLAAMPVLSSDRVVGVVSVEAVRPRLLSASLVGQRLSHWTRAVVDELRTASLVEQLRDVPLVDPTTSLPNRQAFLRSIDLTLAHMRNFEDRSTAVAVIGLHRLDDRALFDGRDHGDAVVAELGERLRHDRIGASSLARISRDAFGLLFWGLEGKEVRQRCERALQVASSPYLGDVGLLVEADIGLRLDDGEGTGASMLRDAESALGSVRGPGGGTVVFDHQRHRSSTDEDLLARDLRWAIQHSGLRLVHQPIADIETGSVLGFESLLRWHHPLRGPVRADVTIALAEKHGLMRGLGQWVLESAISQTALWRAAHPERTLQVQFNASPEELSESDFADRVLAALQEHGVPGSAMVLEVTESTMIDNLATTRSNLQRLKQEGVTICVDDFGVGTSSLSRLHQSAAQRLKIDRSFIAGLPDDEAMAATVTMILTLARALHLDVVAEGIETAQQAAYLRSMGVRRGQGYYLSRPLETPEASAVLERGLVVPG